MAKTFTFGAKSLVADARKRRTVTMRDELRASGRVETSVSDTSANGTTSSTVSRGWQQEAWQFYDQVGEAHYCADPETEILTDGGWRRYDEVARGTVVLTLNTETGLSEWQPMEALNVFPLVNEQMLALDTKQHSSLTTMNHRWPTLQYRRSESGEKSLRPRFTDSASLNCSDRIITAAPCADLPEQAKWDDALVELVAWFWTEGTISQNPGQSSKRLSISQSPSANPAYVSRIRKALTTVFGEPEESLRGYVESCPSDHPYDEANTYRDKHGYRQCLICRRGGRSDTPRSGKQFPPGWREYNEPNRPMTIFVLNQAAAEQLLTIAPNRIVQPWFIRDLTAAQLELFIATSIAADGHGIHLAQRDPERLSGFELACILSGRTPHTYLQKNEMWNVTALTKSTVVPVSPAYGVDLGKKTVEYTGDVWCPTTPNRTWMARRNGTVYFTGNSAGFIGACLSRCPLTIGIPDSDGHVGPAFDEDGKPLEGFDGATDALQLVRQLKSKIGGQPQLMRSMGINLTVAGELHLVGDAPNGAQTLVTAIENWEVLSTDEFRRSGSDYARYAYPGARADEVKAEAVHVIRMWRNHPRFTELPDSSFKAVQDILEELVLLTREVRGEALSRLARAGILLVPDEIEYPDDSGDDGDGDSGDPFTRDLIQTMSTAISDKASAAQTVPFVVRAPMETLGADVFRLIDLSPKNIGDSAAKRTEAVQRFAQGIDLPVEIVTGHAGTTFANAVQIDDSLFKSHVEPLLEIICDALTAGYLRAALGDDTPFVVYYDSTELVARPNRAQDAKDLYDRFELSGSSLRGATGFSDSDAPDEDELQKRIKIKQLTLVRQTVAVTPEQLQGEDSTDAPSIGDGQPLNQGNLTDGNNTDGTLAASLKAVAEVSIDRAIERAGARLKTKAHKDAAVRASLSQVPNAEVARTLGPQLVERFAGGDDLFHGEFDVLRNWALRTTGSRDYADQLKATCLVIANEKLYAPSQSIKDDDLPVLALNA